MPTTEQILATALLLLYLSVRPALPGHGQTA